MKKFVSLLLALALCCTAVMALAEAPSKTVADLNTTETEGDALISTLNLDDPAVAQYAAAFLPVFESMKNAASVEEFFAGFDIKTLIGAETLNVNECVLAFANPVDAYEGTMQVTFGFATPYAEGEKVAVMTGIANGTEVNWNMIEGTGNADGAVVCDVDYNTYKTLSDNSPVLVAVVSK